MNWHVVDKSADSMLAAAVVVVVDNFHIHYHCNFGTDSVDNSEPEVVVEVEDNSQHHSGLV